MKNLGYVAHLLVIIGAINWGLIGLLDMNLVNMIFGSLPTLEKIVYILVWVAGVYEAYLCFKKK